MRIPYFLFGALFLIACKLVEKNSPSLQVNYACNIKITGYWKIDSLEWHKNNLKQKNILFEYDNVKTNDQGYLECLNISVSFPDVVSGRVGNCSNSKTLQDLSYSIGFERPEVMTRKKGFNVGYFRI